MMEKIKLSKFTRGTTNEEGDLILYNFVTGINSLTKVPKDDVYLFNQIIKCTTENNYLRYKKIYARLLDLGILVDERIDENVVYEAAKYEEIFDSVLTLTILPTGYCNFSCSYCFEKSKPILKKAMSVDSQDAIIQFVQKQVSNYKKIHICWFGGEPLLELQTILKLSQKFIQICKKRFVPYAADIVTNGYYLDHNTFDLLYNQKIYNYKITLDGFKEQHDSTRNTGLNKGSFDRIISNLIEIRDNKQYKLAHICIRVNLTRNITGVLDEFIDYLNDLFADDSRFLFQFVPVKNFSKSEFIDRNIIESSTVLLEKLMNNLVYTNKLLSEKDKIDLIMSNNGCVANQKNSYVITPDLRVYKCCVHFDIYTNNLGYIDKAGNLIINDGLHRKWYLLSKAFIKIPEKCNNCFYLPSCRYGNRVCPLYYLDSKDIEMDCMADNELFLKNIDKTIVYISNKYPCYSVRM